MASIYRRRNSPFWWIKYRVQTGEIRYESTGLKVGVGKHTRIAQELCAERTLAERRYRGIFKAHRWEAWVPNFLTNRYRDKAQSYLRYTTAWRTIRMFLAEREIFSPAGLTREDVQAYFEWRKSPNVGVGKYRAGHNTALLEIKTLAIILKEAVFRGYIQANPCRDLGLGRVRGKTKSYFDPAEIAIARERIAKEPEPLRTFLANSFEIARYQGCRLSETHLNPMSEVDVENRRITFRAKGGKSHTTRLHEALVPLFSKLRAEGRTETYRPPKSPAKTWFNFLKRIGLKDSNPNLCFHSLRVLVATELARANVHESKAMKFLGHASTTVHRSYQRLRPDDLADAVAAISGGAPRPTEKTDAPH